MAFSFLCKPSPSCLTCLRQGLSQILACFCSCLCSLGCEQPLSAPPTKTAASLGISSQFSCYWDGASSFGGFRFFYIYLFIYFLPLLTDVFFALHTQPGLLSLGDKLMKAAPKRGRGDGFVQEKKGRGGRGGGRGRNNKTSRCHFAASARLDYPIAIIFRAGVCAASPPPHAA